MYVIISWHERVTFSARRQFIRVLVHCVFFLAYTTLILTALVVEMIGHGIDALELMKLRPLEFRILLSERGMGVPDLAEKAGIQPECIYRQYPELAIFGGIDKRILAQSKDAIDRELERILPVMRERGGYIPTCDHGVPEEVSYENYLHFRKRSIELAGE